jgi:hypothetical protein
MAVEDTIRYQTMNKAEPLGNQDRYQAAFRGEMP